MSRAAPWSYSKLNTYLTCKHMFYRKYVTKDVKDESSPEALAGQKLHSQLEAAIKGEGPGPADFPAATAMCERLRNVGAKPELALGVRQDWAPCGFWASDVWGRTKIDSVILSTPTALVVDWKTGNPKNKKYLDEFELVCQAAIIAAEYPNVTTVNAAYYFVRDDSYWAGLTLEGTPRKYYTLKPAQCRTLVQGIVDEIDNRGEDKFTTKKNPLCNGWCPVKDCKHWRPKRA